MIELIHGDCLDEMKKMEDNSVDSIVTDPPYGLSFMGKKWDYDVPSEEVWIECLRVLKPGGYLLSFAGTRTQHRMAVRIEDAGFEIRDMIAWIYGSGFPKSLNIGKAVDKLQGNEREVFPNPRAKQQTAQKNTNAMNAKGATTHISIGTSPYEGWGTALKPALEPITVARKPLTEKTVAQNVLTHGTGGLNIDGCRVGTEENLGRHNHSNDETVFKLGFQKNNDGSLVDNSKGLGRFPANLIHDGSEEVVGLFPGEADKSTARFFYAPKASKKDRDEGLEGFEEQKKPRQWAQSELSKTDYGSQENKHPSKNHHPTVKPTDLMRYLCRLVTPKGGTILDPFMGSGSTGKGAVKEGFNFIGMELDKEYYEIAKSRIHDSSN